MIKRNYWQKKLTNITTKLRNRRCFIKENYNDDAELEFNIISGFYIVRKLIEHKKLTNKLISTKISGYKYPFKSEKPITPFNDHKWPEFYDFEEKKKEKFELIFLCNKFIHSFYFIALENFVDNIDEDIESLTDDQYFRLLKKYKRKKQTVLFNSDDTKSKYLYEISIDSIIEIFNNVSLTNITTSSIKYDQRQKTYKYFQSDEIVTITEEELFNNIKHT